MTELTLYKLTDDQEALANTLDMTETEEQRAACQAEIDRLMELQLKKVDDFCGFLAHLESQIRLVADESRRLKDFQGHLESTLERLEQYAVRIMEMHNQRKLDGNTSQLRLRNNSPAVEITDVDLLPPEFKVIHQMVTADKRAIKKALEEGREVAGADLRFGRTTLVRK